MAYIIYNNDGTVLLTLPEGEVNSDSTSLDLIGKNVNNYGQYFNNNLVKLLTNFSSNTEPAQARQGQLWYNADDKVLHVHNGSGFVPVTTTKINGTQPENPGDGDLWFDAINEQLKIWDGSSFKVVGPATTRNQGLFGSLPPTVSIYDYPSNIPQPVGVQYVYSNAWGLATTSSFTMSPNTSSVYIGVNTSTEIVAGLTVFEDFDVKGNLYVEGDKQVPPNRTLSTYYDIASFGGDVDAGNVAIATNLGKLFPLTTSTFNSESYSVGSEVRVLCNNAGTTSVRRFVSEFTIGLGYRWIPDTRYFYDASTSTTATNIIP
jgi:hypothetical protein